MKRIYLDHAAATPVRPEVLEAMLPYFQERFGNPSAVYDLGAKVKDTIEEQRSRVADLIGAPGDTINLNVEGVTYNFKENVRRNTLSAYLPSPVSGDRVWGDGNNSWTPPENITILGIKVQYACADGGTLQLALKDKDGNVIANLNGFSCNSYNKLAEELEYYLTMDNGMYVDVLGATEGITNVTITIEFIYDNR